MNVFFFSVHCFEKQYLERWASELSLEAHFSEAQLGPETASAVINSRCISCWANDKLDRAVLEQLRHTGVEMISLRSAGYSHLDVEAAKELGFRVARVPAYSPQAIAEHTLGLLLSLNRHLPKSFRRVKDFNFTLEGLEGVTLAGKTIGIVGAGNIGAAFARIMRGMECRILIHDPTPDRSLEAELGAQFVELNELLSESDVISLHCPLNKSTHHLLAEKEFQLMKQGAFLLNTGRGALIQTKALIEQLKQKKFRGVGLDVYEYEEGVFFNDHSETGISDETLLRLMSFPNVLITSHQAFLTEEALNNIAKVSMKNIQDFLSETPINGNNCVV